VRVELRAPSDQRAELKALGLSLKLVVRFVTVRLSTGELEVLATSLLDEAAYPTEAFAEAYWHRWGIETFYGRLKGRLDLENFSGQTVNAVEQDFQAMLFLSNMESIVSAPAQAELPQPSAQRKQSVQVNKAVSLHALKSHLIELLASAVPLEEVFSRLEGWFVHNPVALRPDRKVPRRKPSAFRSYQYQRRVRKIVF
jgi:Transposase DDE domain